MVSSLKGLFDKGKPKEVIGHKKKEEIRKLLKVINEVEDTAVQIKLGILNYEMLQQERDSSFSNKLERFLYLKEIIHLFLFQLLEPKDFILELQDSNVEIIEEIFRFKKRFLYNQRTTQAS